MAIAAAKSFFGGFTKFLLGKAVSRDDRLGNRENRKKLAARAFLEGYEPDPRLFAKGPDDAPDVFMPEPLAEPVQTYLPPQPQAPQLVGATTGAVGEEFVVREIERINANVNAIALAMEANAKADADYRQSIIRQQKDRLAQRGAARSRRRSSRSRGVRNFLRKRSSGLRRGFTSTFSGFRGNFAAFAILEAVDQLQKRFDTIVDNVMNMIPEQVRNMLGLEKETEDTKTTPSTPSTPAIPTSSMGKAGGVDIGLLASATGFHEGDYGVMGVEEPTKGGFPLGKYQFMSYRSDVQQKVRSQLESAGYSDQEIVDILVKASQHGPKSKESAKIMLDHFPKEVQDELFEEHARAVIDHILSKNPNATPAEIVNEFGKIHLGGYAYRPGSADSLGTTVEQHGENIMNTYLDMLRQQAAREQAQAPAQVLKQETIFNPDLLGSMPYIGPISTFGEGMSVMEPTILDLRKKDFSSPGGAAASSDFDVSNVILDPFVNPSEYAGLLGVN